MTKLTPDDAERLFSSHVDDDDPRLGTLASFVRELRETYVRPPDPDTQSRHLRAMAEEFAVRPSAASPRRRRLPVGRAAAAALLGSVLVAGSALAATGHLPDPAQSAVADAVKVVGLTIPAGGHGASGKTNGDAGKARAAANKARAKEFTDAKKSWTECVAEKAREHTGPGTFDPQAPPPAGCGPKPRPQEFRPAPAGAAGHDDHGNGKAKDDGSEHGNSASSPNPGHGQDDQAPANGAPVPTPGDSGGHGGHGQGDHGPGGDAQGGSGH